MKPCLPHILVLVVLLNWLGVTAQVAGDYRSVSSGEWKNVQTWQQYNGTTWMNATNYPTYSDGDINIRNGDTVLVTDTIMVDQLTIDLTGVLHITTGNGKTNLILNDATGNDIVSNGKVMVDALAVLSDDTTGGGANIFYTKDSIINNGGILPQVVFRSNKHQVLVGSGYMGPIVVSSPNNLEITGTSSFQSVLFKYGKIVITGDGILLVSQYANGFSGQNENSFVDGKVNCIIYETAPVSFTLPLGKGEKYLPIAFNIQQTNSVETQFTFTITGGAPPQRSLPASLGNVSTVRFYTITKSSSASSIANASLQLSYGEDDKVSDPANLRIAKSNEDDWRDLGGMGTGAPEGTISSAINFISGGDFVLANSVGGTNTLPVNFTSFTASPVGKSVLLFWEMENEASVKMYEIERREGRCWKSLQVFTSTNLTSYTATDNTAQPSQEYAYRLKQINKDGQIFYSKVVIVKTGGIATKMQVRKMYPIPATNVLFYFVEDEKDDQLNVTIQNMQGAVICTNKIRANVLSNINLSKLSAGNYVLSVVNERTGQVVIRKLTKN